MSRATSKSKSSQKDETLFGQIKKSPRPRHIGVIMDGNGRWARKHSLQRIEGHKKGAEVVDALMDSCLRLKIPVVSLYAFSTENWRRPSFEVKALFELLNLYISDKLPKMMQNEIRFIVSGDIDKLPVKSRKLIVDGMQKTRKNKKMLANFCINYGARDELMKAINEIVAERAASGKAGAKVSAKEFEKHLYTRGLPDVDLLIRTSGEQRISNFLLYQSAYAELYFTDILWPDFTESDLYKSIIEFQRRDRRYGGV